MVEGLLKDIQAQMDVSELARKLEVFSTIPGEPDEAAPLEQGEGSAVDIREDWAADDEEAYRGKSGRRTHPKKTVSFAEDPVAPAKQATVKTASPASPRQVVVKDKVVERKATRPAEPASTIMSKHVRESMFRRELRKDAASDQTGGETLSPN